MADVSGLGYDDRLRVGPTNSGAFTESLLLQDVAASVGKGKFLGTKQFTVRGAKTVKGLIPTHTDWHFSQSGDAEVSIRWEATFRMKGAGKARR